MDYRLRTSLICFAVAIVAASQISCGGVDYVTVDGNDLQALCFNGEPCIGVAYTDTFGECTIYMAPVEQYPSVECFNAVLAHEQLECSSHHTLTNHQVPECHGYTYADWGFQWWM